MQFCLSVESIIEPLNNELSQHEFLVCNVSGGQGFFLQSSEVDQESVNALVIVCHESMPGVANHTGVGHLHLCLET